MNTLKFEQYQHAVWNNEGFNWIPRVHVKQTNVLYITQVLPIIFPLKLIYSEIVFYINLY